MRFIDSIMQIFNHAIKINQDNKYNKQPSFGYRLPKTIFTDIKDIPHLKCGCCGKDTFRTSDITNLLKGFEAGSKRALENEALARFRETEAFAFLTELSKANPKATIRTLLNSKDAVEKFKDLHERTQLDIRHMALISEGITVKAPRVIAKLSKFKEYFGEDLQLVFEQMERYAEKYPKNTFAEIFNKSEVKDFHIERYNASKSEKLSRQIEVFKQLKEIGNKLSPADRARLLKTNSDAIKLLNLGIYEPDIKKALVDDLYLNFYKDCSNRRIKKKLMQTVAGFPYDVISPVDSFIVKSVDKKRTDKDIVMKFLRDMQSTFEHAKPHSKQGSDDWENGIVFCQRCNRKRADLPYPFFLGFFPQMKKNIQQQCNKIMTFIRHGKLTGHDSYPFDIKKTLLEETDNIIKLNITKYLKFKEHQAELKQKRAESVFANDDKWYNEISKSLADIDERIAEALKTVRQLKKTRQMISNSVNEAAAKREKSALTLEGAEVIYKNALRSLIEDGETNKNIKCRRIKKRKD